MKENLIIITIKRISSALSIDSKNNLNTKSAHLSDVSMFNVSSTSMFWVNNGEIKENM